MTGQKPTAPGVLTEHDAYKRARARHTKSETLYRPSGRSGYEVVYRCSCGALVNEDRWGSHVMGAARAIRDEHRGQRFRAATQAELDCAACGASAGEPCQRTNWRGKLKPCVNRPEAKA